VEERAWALVGGNEPGYEARNTLLLCVHRSCSLPDDVDQNKPSYATCRGPQVVHIFHSIFRKYQCEFAIEPIESQSQTSLSWKENEKRSSVMTAAVICTQYS